ncbi:hypothetical protein J4406_02170 [Candidatus Woesearchaeota archaeon]|nr:hypothetical protein [Candidatus Woesearchaeota archaeon]
MKEWDENLNEISKVVKDKEKAKSLLKLVELREKNVKSLDKNEFITLIIEDYYEIIKELITAVMSVDGYKSLSHELLVGYLAKFYKEFSMFEINIIDQLRRARNDIAYRGVMIRLEYLERNEKSILKIIQKLKNIVNIKIK